MDPSNANELSKELATLKAQIAATRQSEARLRSMINVSPDYIILHDADGTILDINHTEPEMTVDQVIGTTIYQYMPESYHAEAGACLRRVWESGTTDSYETVYEAQDGTTRYFHTIVAILRCEGAPTTLLSQSRDVTAYQLALKNLQVKSDALALSQKMSNIGSWELELKTGSLAWSDQVYRIFGLAPQEFDATYEAFLKVIHPDDKEMVNQAYSEAMENKTPYDIVHRILRADGQERIVREMSKDIVDDTGVVTRSQGVVHDITEQHFIQKELAERERFVSTLLGNLPGMVYRCQNKKDWPMEYLSEGCAQITGYQPAELMADGAHSYSDLIHPDDQARVWETVQGALATQTHFEVTYRIKTADGQERWLWERGQGVFNATDGLIALEGFVTDYTHVKQEHADHLDLERKVMRTQKLESLGLMAGGIAHDFNNLLTIILGNADLAHQDLPPQSPAQKYIEKIETTSHRAADLAQQMLAYSGKGQFAVTNIDLNELLASMVQLMKTSIDQTASLSLNIPDDDLCFKGDATQIRQVVMNLITNAVEAIDGRDGTITVSSSAVFCSQEYLDGLCETHHLSYEEQLPAGYYICLAITDSGSGMDPEIMGQIFDPFFSTKFTGRGLGLAATLGIIRGHKGALSVTSEAGLGTSFKVLFPAAQFSDRGITSPEPAQAIDDWQGHGSVLFAEDEEQVSELGQQMLRRLGFNVITVGDGRAAVDKFRSYADEISVVLLDLTMPILDGAEACREILAIRPQTRIILCSGYSAKDLTNGAVGDLISGFLQKPFTYRELQHALKKALESG